MNVVVISIDCARSGSITCYSEQFPYYLRFPYSAETPHIDSVAKDGTVYRNAFCQAPFTPGSHGSIFTGLNPYNHGIRGMFGFELSEDVETMAERFAGAGYETGAFVGAHAISPKYGLDRGFERFDDDFDRSRANWVVGQRRPASEVTDSTLQWMNDVDGDFLAFVHYFDAHDGGGSREGSESSDQPTSSGPFEPLRSGYHRFLEPADDRLGNPVSRTWDFWQRLRLKRRYGRRYHLRQVRKVDRQIGRITEALRRRGLYDETMIVITADHGDAFGEHGEESHRKYLYDTTLHIPLVIKPPHDLEVHQPGTDVLARSVDIFPTIASCCDVDIPDIDGVDLFGGDAEGETRSAYAETRFEKSHTDLSDLVTNLAALRTTEWKLVFDRATGARQLYDLEDDPRERKDVSTAEENVADDLEEELHDLAGEQLWTAPTMREEERGAIEDHLSGLGYL